MLWVGAVGLFISLGRDLTFPVMVDGRAVLCHLLPAQHSTPALLTARWDTKGFKVGRKEAEELCKSAAIVLSSVNYVNYFLTKVPF